MNYSRIYDLIINNRLNNPVIGYTEKHHIIPKSLGGDDSSYNLVRLTAREHYICHLLLVKIHKNNKPNFYKMVLAANMMCAKYHTQSRDYNINSTIYEKLKLTLASQMSKHCTGEGNSQWGMKWYTNITLRLNKKFKPDDIIPEGWIHGRIGNWEFLDRCCLNCKNHLNLTAKSQKTLCNECLSLSTKNRTKTEACMKKCMVYGIEYKSVKEAAIANNLNEETMRMRIVSKSKNGCYYL